MSNWPDWLPLRDDLRGLSAYGAPQITNVAALNTNENPFPLPNSVIDSMIVNLKEILPNLNRYPDRDAVKLRSSLSEYINGENNLNLKFENIWVANGSNEILQTLVLACGQRGVLGFTPSYSMHPIITKVCGATWISGVRNDDFTLDVEKAKSQIRSTKPSIIFVTTPNNPTGTEGAFPFSANAGDKFSGWDCSTNFDFMPNQSLTFRIEFVHRESSVPYFAGVGGVTSQTGYSTTPLDPNWRPDLVKSENRIILVALFRL